MRLKDYSDYFEAVAIDNLALSHKDPLDRVAFLEIGIDQVIDKVSFELGNTCLFLEHPRIRPTDALSDNPRQIMSSAFLIMTPHVTNDGPDKIIEIRNETYDIAEQVLSRIRNDFKKANLDKGYEFKIKGFDLGSVSQEFVGPIFNNWFGWRTAFAINQIFTNNLTLDPLKWKTAKPSTIR